MPASRRLSGALRPPGILGVPPVDTLQQAGQLRGGQRHCSLARRGPYEPALLEPLGVERHADPIVPDDLDQRACAAAEYEQIAAMRITLEPMLHQQREALHPLAHIRVAERDPHPRARWDHHNPFSAAVTSAGDAAAKTLSRLPRGRSMIIAGCSAALIGAASPSIVSGVWAPPCADG